MHDPDGRQIGQVLHLFALQAEGREIRTIEGMRDATGGLHPIQKAFWENHGLQCGFCTPGMIMQTAWLLQENPDPTEEDVRLGLSATSAGARATRTS